MTGKPFLYGTGTLIQTTATGLHLRNARPGAPTFLVVGINLLQAGFMGGILVPTPDQIIGGLVTNGSGHLDLVGAWPIGLPSCQEFYFQTWTVDPVGPAGLAASNGIVGQTP